MARITLTREEYESGALPPVCIVCGEHTHRQQMQAVSQFPLSLFVMGLCPISCCFIVPAVVSIIMILTAKYRRVVLPVCEADQHHWRFRAGLIFGFAGATWGSVVLAFNLPLSLDVDPFLQVVLTSIIPTFAFLFLARHGVHASQIETDHLTLSGVHPDFVAAVERMREEADEWPESR